MNCTVDVDCRYRLTLQLRVRIWGKNIPSCSERWPRGLKRRIANPLYKSYVPRVRIPLSPLTQKIDKITGKKLSVIINIYYSYYVYFNNFYVLKIILYVQDSDQGHLIKIKKQKEKKMKKIPHLRLLFSQNRYLNDKEDN